MSLTKKLLGGHGTKDPCTSLYLNLKVAVIAVIKSVEIAKINNE